ncbi:unnamed protein product [Brassicogethes aeneus]|uniref:C2H2-type domain-containing protein n=1 Tax=Brassicogethes aeneus TaxID=1431903 RepID=A0A9P0AVG6_BRAAE|nr:unnamed protein product [Brassicogethes aeneus]
MVLHNNTVKHSIKLEPKDEVPQSMTNEKQNTYNCESCAFSTTKFQKYLSHTIFCKYPRTPTKVNHTLCPYCNLKVNSDLALESHVFSKHKELNDVKEEVELTEFKCNKCSYKTSKLEEYIVHYGTHKNCPYCGKQFISTKGLQGHVLGKHKIQNDVENKFALIYKTYENYSIGLEPEENLVNEKQNNSQKLINMNISDCPYCSFKAHSNFSLQGHVYSKHRELNGVEMKVKLTYKILTCKNCTFASIRPTSYTIHRKTCLSPRETCPYCEKKFRSPKNLQGHVLSKHKNQNNVEKKLAISYKTYKEHFINLETTHEELRSMDSEKQKTYNCKMCDFFTTEFQKYLSHTIFCKYPRKPLIVECPYCYLQINSDPELQAHALAKHKEQNEIEKKINIKTKAFSTTSKFIPNIKCLLCPFETKNRKEYILHHKKHVEKNLRCPYCFLKTNKGRELQRHVFSNHRQQNEIEKKVETSVTSLNCKKCGFNTVRNDAYATHLKLCNETKERQFHLPTHTYKGSKRKSDFPTGHT